MLRQSWKDCILTKIGIGTCQVLRIEIISYYNDMQMERPNASCLNMYVEVQNSPKIELFLDGICFAESLIKYLNSIIAISERESDISRFLRKICKFERHIINASSLLEFSFAYLEEACTFKVFHFNSRYLLIHVLSTNAIDSLA